jgi:hypothetical protein
MKHTHGEGVLFLALFAALVACSDSADRSVGPTASKDVQVPTTAAIAGPERVALTKIARLVAVAMDDEGARQRLKRDLRAAPFREHKLQLTTYLHSRDGRALLEEMAARSRRGESEVFDALAAIRPLELYMPVVKHRESWTGKGDILVVSQLDESAPIVAFDERGREVSLDRKVAPEQPTLSIVPVETRFDEPLPAAGSRNVGDLSGNAIGTLERMVPKGSSLIACGETCIGGGGGGGGTAPPIAPGLYLEYSRIVDFKEPWFRGEPELEVHIQGPNNPANPTYGEDLSCSGEHAYDFPKVFNQDNAFWEGRVQLYSEAETVAFLNKFSQGFHVLFWEDDNQPCLLKLDSNGLIDLLKSTASAVGSVALKVIPNVSWSVVGIAFLGTLFSNPAPWLLTNDDFLGVAVDLRTTTYSYPGNTHVIMDGTTLNGRANIVYHH